MTKRINHHEAYSDDGACTNDAESFLSVRRAKIGIYHHISGKYLDAYDCEMAWREGHRRGSSGEQYLLIVNSVLAHPLSRQWKGIGSAVAFDYQFVASGHRAANHAQRANHLL